jgi:hypothetical protein
MIECRSFVDDKTISVRDEGDRLVSIDKSGVVTVKSKLEDIPYTHVKLNNIEEDFKIFENNVESLITYFKSHKEILPITKDFDDYFDFRHVLNKIYFVFIEKGRTDGDNIIKNYNNIIQDLELMFDKYFKFIPPQNATIEDRKIRILLWVLTFRFFLPNRGKKYVSLKNNTIPIIYNILKKYHINTSNLSVMFVLSSHFHDELYVEKKSIQELTSLKSWDSIYKKQRNNFTNTIATKSEIDKALLNSIDGIFEEILTPVIKEERIEEPMSDNTPSFQELETRVYKLGEDLYNFGKKDYQQEDTIESIKIYHKFISMLDYLIEVIESVDLRE